MSQNQDFGTGQSAIPIGSMPPAPVKAGRGRPRKVEAPVEPVAPIVPEKTPMERYQEACEAGKLLAPKAESMLRLAESSLDLRGVKDEARAKAAEDLATAAIFILPMLDPIWIVCGSAVISTGLAYGPAWRERKQRLASSLPPHSNAGDKA